jgi:hypothetical protein
VVTDGVGDELSDVQTSRRVGRELAVDAELAKPVANVKIFEIVFPKTFGRKMWQFWLCMHSACIH